MRFSYEATCECGGGLVFLAVGEEKFRPGECSSCGKTARLLDPSSVSVTAERLLDRRAEQSWRMETSVFRSSSQPLLSNHI